jgi:hypothetical protein
MPQLHKHFNVVGNLVTHPNNDTDKGHFRKNSLSHLQQRFRRVDS